ncbi:MAG: nitrogenase molybdenum-iron protein alpha chain [Chlorobium phaeobacteroides]|uniref:Nitrogenase protein alpha chain n=1 Tax=Chlorobium phaeobacteroides (strain BS1) TaxID=331678 RepID=B3EL84_CHLPB|nr:nitrogenase molybdenum-iron protein alpha chain [Chlorobium phaeobacteroides]MBL6956848.1 nitrogenase molybdenum-iron protein alpha chain [Chlorobium phaeobacteroides]NEX14974.1 nitrogenase molybdenum-iron protein alpha chain [Prosthecochloris sp.]
MESRKYPEPSVVREELIKKYPPKVAKKRGKAIVINDPETIPPVQANIRTIPGIISQRGCSYAGCKGVVLGPTRDIVNLVHGPIGCSFYAWLTRRNQTRPDGPDDKNYMTYCFSTDMQEEHVVFGGEKKLKEAIQEAYDIFRPKAIGIFSTCPVGLIGDDVHAVAREMKEKLGDCNIFGFSCEGYKGVSQSAGHHIANNQVFKHVVGLDDTDKGGKFKINMLGEYNIGGDAFEIERLLEKCGITMVASFSGNSTVNQFENSHTADLNVIMCHRSINYMAEMMETKYGIPWMKVNFIGAESSAKSLRRIARYFEDEELMAKVEQVIAEELPVVQSVINEIYPRTKGKLAMLFVGGSRAHHYQELFGELGMETISAGYEFGHRDDYEGRKVIPNIKVDADSKNIEELKVTADPEKFKPRKTEEELEKLKAEGLDIREYEGMMPDMKKGSIVIDDISHYESEKLIELYKPDIFCAGIKEKYVVQKMGVPLKQLHSYDYGGPYAGFKGAINFYRDIDRMVNSRVWKLIQAPWEETTELEANYVTQ